MRYFERRKARIEIIPMIDIMLFLLVFFVMITLKMIPATGMAAKMPSSSTAEDMKQTPVVVTVLDDGTIKVKEQTLTPEQLTAMMRQQDPTKTSVTVVGTKTVPLQVLLQVMDAIRTGGITQIGIAARKNT